MPSCGSRAFRDKLVTHSIPYQGGGGGGPSIFPSHKKYTYILYYYFNLYIFLPDR